MQKLSLETLNVNGLLDEEGHLKKSFKKCYGVAMYAWSISDTMHKILFSPKGHPQLLKSAVCLVTGISE